MSAELLQTLINGGGTAVLIWMTYNLWNEVKAQNERIYQLLQQQLAAAEERQALAKAVGATLPPRD